MTQQPINSQFEIQRLYTLYQNGTVADHGGNSDLLKVAKAVADDLTIEEFADIAKQVAAVQTEHDPKTKRKTYQNALWELPARIADTRGADYAPKRTRSNEPVLSDSMLDFPFGANVVEQNDLVPPIAPSPSESINSQPSPLAEIVERVVSDDQPIASPADVAQSSGTRASQDQMGDYLTLKPEDLVPPTPPPSESVSNKPSPIPATSESNSTSLFSSEALQARLKSLPHSEVRHNDALEYAWQAAQQGKLDNFLQSDEGWLKRNFDAFSNPETSVTATRDQLAEYIAKHAGAETSFFQRDTVSSAGKMTEQFMQGKVAGVPAPHKDGPANSPHWAPSDKAPSSTPELSPNPEPSLESDPPTKTGGIMDTIQLLLDGAGVVEPTPFSDLTNSGISIIRALSEPKQAGKHLMNAGISLISTLPYLGDVAKLGKTYGKGGKTLGKSASGIIENWGMEWAKSGSQPEGAGNVFTQAMGGLGSFLAGGSGGGGSGSGGGGGSAGGDSDANSGDENSSIRWLSSLSDKAEDLVKRFGAIGVAIGAFIAGMKLLNDWTNKVNKDGAEMLEKQKRLAEYNGEISTAYMKLQSSRERREMDRADFTAPSLAGLASSQDFAESMRSDRDSTYARTGQNFQAVMLEISGRVNQIFNYCEPFYLLQKAWYALEDSAKDEGKEARNDLERALRELGPEIEKAIKNDKAMGLPARVANRMVLGPFMP